MTTPQLTLSDRHIFYSAAPEIQQRFGNTLLPHAIEYFEYVRVYNDGHCICLSNKADILRYVFDNDIPVVAPVASTIVRNKFHYLILPETEAYIKALHDVKTFFNLSYFMNLVERHADYIEIGCFGGNENNASIINFYINHFPLLENAFHDFRETYAPLIRETNRNKVLLPLSMRPAFSGLSSVHSKTRFHRKLTLRQTDCLFYLVKGMTIKSIARTMQLAPKTVEHYLNTVKSKLNCHTRTELIGTALKLSVIRNKIMG